LGTYVITNFSIWDDLRVEISAFSSASACQGPLPQPLHVAHEWDTEEAFVLPIEVGGVVVAHAIGRTCRVEVFAKHQTTGLQEPQPLLELQGAQRRGGGIENMDIKRSGSQPSGKGPAEYFTGAVRIDPLFEAPDPARAVGASVTFEPGARTAWHSHPLGQTLIVTAGCGRAQRWGGPIEEIRPGDVIWFPPGEKHWHGATPTTAMTHIAIQERLAGLTVDWMEQVSDEQYQA
jgi:quercetin dioxygenase-like cupin family protein